MLSSDYNDGYADATRDCGVEISRLEMACADLQSRLSRAEEALRGLHRWLTDPGVKVLCEGLPEQMGYSGACQKVVAALQPETDDPAAKYYPPDALQPGGEKK